MANKEIGFADTYEIQFTENELKILKTLLIEPMRQGLTQAEFDNFKAILKKIEFWLD